MTKKKDKKVLWLISISVKRQVIWKTFKITNSFDFNSCQAYNRQQKRKNVIWLILTAVKRQVNCKTFKIACISTFDSCQQLFSLLWNFRTSANPSNKLPSDIRPYLVFNCEKTNHSDDYRNMDEVILIKKLLRTIYDMLDRNNSYTVGIITPYNAQKDLLVSHIG